MNRAIVITFLSLFTLNTFAATEIASVSERNSNRSLSYSRKDNELIFTLVNGTQEKEIKRLTFNATTASLQIAGDQDVYTFDFLENMTRTSGKAYKWCWTKAYKDRAFGESIWLTPATSGYSILVFGAIPTMALCATAPGVPFILGILAAPVDGLISLGDRIFDADTVAARRFSKLLRGKNRKASRAVFSSLVQQISEL